MKRLLLLSLLLGTVSAFHLESNDPHLDSPKRQPDLGQVVDGAGEQGQLTQVMHTEGEEPESSGCWDAFENEVVESDPAAVDKDLECPREEDTVHMKGDPGCKTCRYLLVRTPKTFDNAQSVCRRCYRGNLVSIHSYSFNYQVQCGASQINQAQVWIGGILKGWYRKFCCWDFGYWAPGQPGNGKGHCVALCTKGGHWRRASCQSHLPFVCSY
uniref:Proteoglycan 3 n=1 Tax=Jaculus jaculus TaxID=51337 RepID=A0A8C5KB85_JACJA